MPGGLAHITEFSGLPWTLGSQASGAVVEAWGAVGQDVEHGHGRLPLRRSAAFVFQQPVNAFFTGHLRLPGDGLPGKQGVVAAMLSYPHGDFLHRAVMERAL
jgi:hypothetical protein